ncbi:hypothetical protein FBUS_06132 [Fasciolopsis buskii]|uniref:CWH43-like N-terminal domain-containing protein n=1 Tax=Fasciolopsis buskii TaxID=27845 RepID=A0A8E0RUM1_9TREM|nr:hypothetical protein FBUS_06132 [Fasciolopsis buski]
MAFVSPHCVLSQETGVWSVHLAGATALYLFGCIYLVLVTHLSRCYFAHTSNLWQLRAGLGTVAFISAILLPTTGTVARFMYDGKNIRIWQPENRGYGLHVVSSTSEWLLSASFLLFYTTMIFELKDYTIVAIKVRHRWLKIPDDCDVVLS